MLHVRIVMLTPISSQPSWEKYVYFRDAQQVHMIELISVEMISASTCYFGVIVSSCIGYMCTIWIKLVYER